MMVSSDNLPANNFANTKLYFMIALCPPEESTQ